MAPDRSIISGDERLCDVEASGASSAEALVGEISQVAGLLEELRALGLGRVLEDVLTLVLDAAVEVTGAERAFIMLADETAKLECKQAREMLEAMLADVKAFCGKAMPADDVTMVVLRYDGA